MQSQHPDMEKILISTRDDVQNLKKAFAVLHGAAGNATEHELKKIYSELNTHLKKVESNVDERFAVVLRSSMVNLENTLNQVPSNNLVSRSLTLPQIKNPQSTKNVLNESLKSTQRLSQSTKQAHFQRILSDPNSKNAQEILRNKFNLTPAKQPDKKDTLQLLSSNPPSAYTKGNLSVKLTKPIGILPRRYRDNPYSVPPITQSDLAHGMISLINRGIVPKDFDLTLPLERGGPPLTSKKAAIYESQALPSSVRPEMKSPFLTSLSPTAGESTKQKPKHFLSQKKLSAISIHTHKSRSIDTKETNLADTQVLLSQPKMTSFEEVLDRYQFIIRKGKTLRHSPQFQMYARSYFGIWENIEKIIAQLEQIFVLYDVNVAYISGRKLADLALSTITKPTTQQLLDCVVNREEVERFVNNPSLRYSGSNRAVLAAIKIQSVWRMHSVRKNFKGMNNFFQHVAVIQSCVRVFLKHRRTLQEIKAIKDKYRHENWLLVEKLKKEWAIVSTDHRYEVHICGLNYDETQRMTMHMFKQRQNAQIMRLFALKDPSLHIIYVTPYELSSEVLAYYSKIMELGGVTNFMDRLWIITPENQSLFPSHFSVSRTLLYSPKALKQITDIISAKKAYIVPAIPSIDDVQLASRLRIPLLSGNDLDVGHLSKQSGAKMLFEECKIPTPIFVADFWDENSFIDKFVEMIVAHPLINTWFIKIDTEFEGRGVAWVSLDSIKQLNDIRKRGIPIPEKFHSAIREALVALLPHKMHIAKPGLYKNYYEFVNGFKERGGIIEGCPNVPLSQIASVTISFFIAPHGHIKLLGSFDKVSSLEAVTNGYLFPQKSIPGLDLFAFCKNLGKKLYDRGIIGYCNIDLIAFPEAKQTNIVFDEKEKKKRVLYWAIGLRCHMTATTAAIGFFEFLQQGKYDESTGKYMAPLLTESSKGILDRRRYSSEKDLVGKELETQDEKRCFLYFPFLFHPGLFNTDYKSFFHLCRMNGMSYDLENKQGIAFVLLDTLQVGCFGLMTMSHNRRNAVSLANDVFIFLMQIAGQITSKHQESLIETPNDAIILNETVNKIRQLHKHYIKKIKPS